MLELDDSLGRTFVRDTSLQEESVDPSDYFFHLSKSLASVFSSEILSDKPNRDLILGHFYSFIDEEYNIFVNNRISAEEPVRNEEAWKD